MKKIIIYAIMVLMCATIVCAVGASDFKDSIYACMDLNNVSDNAGNITGAVKNGGDFHTNSSCHLGSGCYWKANHNGGVAELIDLNTQVIDQPNGAICGWIRADDYSSGSNAKVWGDRSGAGDWYAVYLNDGASLTWDMYDGADKLATGTGVLDDDSWHHVCTTWGTAGMKLYFDGSLNATNAWTGVWTPSNDFHLGGILNAAHNSHKGWIDEFMVWRKALNATEISNLYNSGTGYSCNQILGAVSVNTTLNITAADDFNSTPINVFSVNITWNNGTTETESTTNGYVYRNFLSNNDLTANISFYDITNYFNLTLYDQTISANNSNTLQGGVYQAIACFNATKYINNNSLTPDSFTIGSTAQTSCFNLTAGNHNVMASLTGWDTKNQTFTIAALSNATYTVANMTSAVLTIKAKDITTGKYLTSYDLTLVSLNHTAWAGESYSSTTNQTFALINGSYKINIDATGYALTDTEANLSLTGDATYTFQLYPTNSLNITFFNENTNTILTGTNISFEIVLDDANASIGWTTNGTYWVDSLAAGNYDIRYRASNDNYAERSYLFTLEERTYNALSLYLINTTPSEDITVTLYDEYGNKLEGYTIKLLRYYAAQNGYLVVDTGLTNTEGQTVLEAERNSAYYKFRILDTDGSTVLKTTTSSQLYDTSITLYVTLGEDVGEALDTLLGVSYTLTWDDTNNWFKLVWDVGSDTVVSIDLMVYTMDAQGNVLYNSSSSTSASGTIYASVAEINGTTYQAKAYATFSGDEEATLLDTLTQSFEEGINTFGTFGLFLTFIILIALAFTGVFNPAAPCILVPTALIITRLANLHGLAWTWITAIAAVGIIIIYLIRDKT